MKKKLIRTAVLTVIAILFLPLISCKTPKYSGVIGINRNNVSILDYESELILDILNGDKWINDFPNCGHDYTFTFDNSSLHYHSECGTFTDIENNLSLELNETDKATVNAVLEKLFAEFDPSWE